jgi:hypothetical protein
MIDVSKLVLKSKWTARSIPTTGVAAIMFPGIYVRLLLPEWIKPRYSFVKDYIANPDHNRWQYTLKDEVLH